jgi:hypothetical protein
VDCEVGHREGGSAHLFKTSRTDGGERPGWKRWGQGTLGNDKRPQRSRSKAPERSAARRRILIGIVTRARTGAAGCLNCTIYSPTASHPHFEGANLRPAAQV